MTPQKEYKPNETLSPEESAKFNATVDKQNELNNKAKDLRSTAEQAHSEHESYVSLKDANIAQYMEAYARKNGYQQISDMIQKAINGGMSIGVAAEKLVKGLIESMMKMYQFYEQQYSKMQDHFSQEAKDARSGLDSIKQLLMRLQDTFQSPYV